MTINGEYYFVEIVRDEYCQLIKSIPEYRTLKKKQFPLSNIKPVKTNEYKVETRIMYVGAYEQFTNKFGVIKLIDHEDPRLTYGILFDEDIPGDFFAWENIKQISPSST